MPAYIATTSNKSFDATPPKTQHCMHKDSFQKSCFWPVHCTTFSWNPCRCCICTTFKLHRAIWRTSIFLHKFMSRHFPMIFCSPITTASEIAPCYCLKLTMTISWPVCMPPFWTGSQLHLSKVSLAASAAHIMSTRDVISARRITDPHFTMIWSS